MADSVPNSPKRNKVLQSWIDERGREVTEVVWEGEESKTKKVVSEAMNKADSTTMKAETNTVTDSIKRPLAAKKSPALGGTASSNTSSKSGSKKAGNQKYPKQGNILSFFKRV